MLEKSKPHLWFLLWLMKLWPKTECEEAFRDRQKSEARYWNFRAMLQDLAEANFISSVMTVSDLYAAVNRWAFLQQIGWIAVSMLGSTCEKSSVLIWLSSHCFLYSNHPQYTGDVPDQCNFDRSVKRWLLSSDYSNIRKFLQINEIDF